MQSTLTHHLQGVVVPKMAIQHQVLDVQQRAYQQQLLADHVLTKPLPAGSR
jgi:hypothetical protein